MTIATFVRDPLAQPDRDAAGGALFFGSDLSDLVLDCGENGAVWGSCT